MNFKNAVAASIALGTLSVALVAFASQQGDEGRPKSYSNPGGSVAVAVTSPDAFSGVRLASTPDFRFQVHDDLTWTVTFHTAVYLSHDTSVDQLPYIAALMPKDAHDCHTLAHRPNQTDELAWSIRKVNTSAENNIVYELHPIPFVDNTTNRPIASYGVSCKTNEVRTTYAGIESYHFELQYLPAAASRMGLTPGVGELSNRLTFTYNVYTDLDQNRDTGVVPKMDTLSIEPDGKADSGVTWVLDTSKSFAVSGTAQKWWISKIDSLPGWVLGLLIAAAASAVLKIIASWFSPKKDPEQPGTA